MNAMPCRILIVDDDPVVTLALRRELLRKPEIGTDGIEIETFNAATEALARVAQADGYFDVAIVDHHMREMDGIDLLDRLRKLRPDTVRMLMTRVLEMDGAIAAINAARVDHLILKPWNEYDLKGRIALALHQRGLQRRRPVATPVLRTEPYRLLLVDDEENVLKALARELSVHERALPALHPGFEISATTSPEAAFQEAKTRCPDIVIADYAMPGMDGIVLLNKLRTACPHCVRILLSGRADTGALTDAINQASVYHFIGKPWDAPVLRAALAEALRYRNLLQPA